MSTTRRIVAVLLCSLLMAACSDGTDNAGQKATEDLDKVTFMLGTRPGPGSAPWLLGIEKGIFEDAGIDLEVLPSDSPSVGMAAVLDGQAQFASVDFTTVALAKGEDPENDMKLLTVTYARPPYTIFSLKSGANVTTPQDLEGETIYGPTGSSMLKVLQVWLDEAGVENVKFKEIDSSAREPLLLAGEIDVIVGFSTSIPPLEGAAADQGDEIAVLEPADHGLDTFYASGISGRESFIEENEDLTRRFIEAHLKAFAYSFEHPEEAGEVLAAEYPEQAVDLTIAGTILLEKLMTDDGAVDRIGLIDPEKVKLTIDYARDVLGITVPPEDLYLNGYVPNDL